MTRDAAMPVCLGGSIFFHILLGMLAVVYLAWFYDKSERPDPRIELSATEPEELTLVLPDMILVEEKTAEEPEEKKVIDATGLEALDEAPENAPFESDRNTRAASALPASENGDEGIPTTDGRPLPAFSLKARDFSDGRQNSPASIPVIFEKKTTPVNSPPPSPNDTPADPDEPPPAEKVDPFAPQNDAPFGSVLASVDSFLEELAKNPDSDVIADKPGEPTMEEEGYQRLDEILPDDELVEPKKQDSSEGKSPPEKQEEKENQQEQEMQETPRPVSNADAAFQMSSPDSRIEGKVNNPGEASVDSAETPLGRYHRKVKEVIGRAWHLAVDLQVDYSSSGFLRVEFYILPDGTTEGVRLTEVNSNAVLQSLTLDVVLKAKLPPPPEDVLVLRADRRVHMKYGFFVR